MDGLFRASGKVPYRIFVPGRSLPTCHPYFGLDERISMAPTLEMEEARQQP